MNARRDANNVTTGLAASSTDGAVLPLKMDSVTEDLLAHVVQTTSAGTAPTRVRRDLNFNPVATGYDGTTVKPLAVDSRNGYLHADVALLPDIETLSGRNTYIYQYNNVLWSPSPANNKILQKSTDWGATWTNLNTFTYNVGTVIVTADGSVLVAQDADDDSTVSSTTPLSFYRSTDGGVTFGGSPVLTLTGAAGVFPFSYDVKDNTVLVGEYGKYNAPYVYKSTDSGATWSPPIFTHPTNGTGTTCHIHSVYIDPYVANLYYVSHGDNSGNRGIWATLDGGSNWTRLTAATDWQPTNIKATATYVFFGEDGSGRIHRCLKSKITSGTFVQASDYEEVYNADTDTRGDFAKVSYYSGAVDNNGIVYMGALSYGASSSFNNGDSLIVASADEGVNWYIIRVYPVLPTISSGCTFIAKVGSNNKLYITNNGSSRTTQTIDSFSVRRYINALT